MSLSCICEQQREQLRKGRGRGEAVPHTGSIYSLGQKKSGKRELYSLGEFIYSVLFIYSVSPDLPLWVSHGELVHKDLAQK